MTELDEWMDRALAIYARRASRHKYTATDDHWAALNIGMVRRAERPELTRLLGFIHRWNWGGGIAWGKPGRGSRGGSHWEAVNVEARNRLFRLDRAADAIEPGANWRAVHGEARP